MPRQRHVGTDRQVRLINITRFDIGLHPGERGIISRAGEMRAGRSCPAARWIGQARSDLCGRDAFKPVKATKPEKRHAGLPGLCDKLWFKREASFIA